MAHCLRGTVQQFAVAVVAAGLVTSAAAPATAAPPPTDLPAPGKALASRSADSGGPDGAVLDGKPRRGDKLGNHDRELLADAQTDGRETVTALVATARGETGAVAGQVEALGGAVGFRDDKLGYVRAQLPTEAVEKTATLRRVLAVDLNESLRLPDPRPAREAAGSAARVAPPGKGTPAANPYLPTEEVGAVTFLRRNPTFDGRGVTIGILDSGVDLDHPSLQTTSTGERKIVDWVTATDPLLEGDRSWRPMITEVNGPTFTFVGGTWTAPEGTFFVNRFSESAAAGGEYGGDVNRDGDDDDAWGVLYRARDNAIWVDVDGDRDFTDEELRRPYREQFQVGHFGTDNPQTPVHESVPFVVEFREDVDTGPAGRPGTADFVNIGIVADSHGSHVAGIAAGNDLFGGAMSGVAPGAKIVSSRACLFAGGCTSVALFEGMLDLVANRGVDVVNMSIGGVPALNDGENARATLYNRLIDDYGVQIFISAGNEGPGVNTVGDPSVADSVVSVGAAVSRETWFANYGAATSAPVQAFNFSARGPTEDGGLKPNVVAPGAAVSTIPLWQAGSPVAEAGYALPPGYGMFNGTSMSSPMTAGAGALLVSAAKASDVPVTPAQMRQALYSSARFLPGIPADAQGAGMVRVNQAWGLLRLDDRFRVGDYTVSAPVCTPISEFLTPPHSGEGIYNRCAVGAGGQAPGQRRTYDVTLTRRSGPSGPRTHRLQWLGNDGTFEGPKSVRLGLNQPVRIQVSARAAAGAHSTVLRIDDPATPGGDGWSMHSVVASTALPAPTFSASLAGRVERSRATSFFVTVPEGAKALQVNLSGIAPGSQTRFLGFHPYGLPVENTSSLNCYTNRPVGDPCNPVSRSYADPTPGVWELVVESRRTTPYLRNPFRLTAAVQGVTVTPKVVEIPSAEVGETVPLEWTLRNDFAPVTVRGAGGPLGSGLASRPTIAHHEQQESTVDVPAGASALLVSIGNPSDLAADLDLSVLKDGVLVAQSADSDSEESVTIEKPEPGTYTVVVDGYDVPAGETEYDYLDVFFAESLGSLSVQAAPLTLADGGTGTLTGSVTVGEGPADGRVLFGSMVIRTEEGAIVGRGGVLIRAVTP